MPLHKKVAATPAGAASSSCSRQVRVVATLAVFLALAVVPAAAIGAQASPTPATAVQRPVGASRDSAAATASDSARGGARDSAAAANPLARTGGSRDSQAATDSVPAAADAAKARTADSLRAASARRGILGELSLVQAIVAIALATLAILLGLGALQLFERYGEMVRSDESLGVTSHWGGFGGGASGWRATPALSLLVSAIILLGGATTVAVSVVARLLPGESQGAPSGSSAGSAPAAPSAPPAVGKQGSPPGN
jgi:hypothetical protein